MSFQTFDSSSPARLFPIARWERAVPLYAEKLFGIRKVLALRAVSYTHLAFNLCIRLDTVVLKIVLAT